MPPETYDKLLTDNVTATYKTATKSIKRKIDLEAKSIAKNLKLDDRIECLAERNAFLTLKDHKENLATSPKCRLLNPAKSEIGTISKLDNFFYVLMGKVFKIVPEISSWSHFKNDFILNK